MTYSSEVLADSPTLYFRLGDASGTTMADSSGNAFNGVYHNAPTLGVTGLLTGDADTAASFLATSSQYGDVASHVVGGGTNYTLETWVKGSSIPTSAFLIAEGRSTSSVPYTRMYVDASGHVNFEHHDDASGAAAITGSHNVKDGNAHHIVGTKNGNVFTLYVDGASDGTTTVSTGTTTLDRTSVGAHVTNSVGNYLTGTLDEAATYTTALSGTRITAHYNAGKGTQSISANFLTASPTLYQPSITTGSATISPPLLTVATTLYSPSITPPTPPSQNVAVPLLNAAPSLTSASIGQVTIPTGTTPAPYVVKMVDATGGSPFTLASAQPEDITWTLNRPTEATISWPKPAYTAAQIPALGTASGVREVQIFRDDDLMFKGRMLQPNGAGSQGAVVGNCVDRLWVLNRRNIDVPQATHILNGSFENAFNSWSHTGSFTATTDATRKVLGTYSAKFVNATANEDAFKKQTFQIGPNGVGVLVTVAAWIYIESITANALGSRGLYIEGGQHSTVQDLNYRALDYQDETLPHGIWIPPEGLQGAQGFVTTLWVPPNQLWDMNVRLYAPQGTVWWDAVIIVDMDSIGSTTLTGSASSEADIAQITRVLVNHVQAGTGKSQEYVGTNCPNNGVKLFRQYQYVDHVSLESAVSEFTQRNDGFDISLEETATTTTFRTWTPKKGTDRSGSVTLTYGGNVADYRWSRDGSGTVTRETVTGEGSGVARAEGEYADATAIGGTILQEVRQAPPETQINSLLPIATEQVNKRGTPPLLLELDVLPSANLIHTLKVGDWITAVVNDGYIQVSGKHRIVKMKLNCRNNVLTVFVNEDN